MPTYDYECSACGHTYEKFQSITAKPERKCPVCGRRTARRLIGAGGGIIFKGSGFYSTDYRSESYNQAAKAESLPASAKPKSDPGGAKKAESKSGGGNGADAGQTQ